MFVGKIFEFFPCGKHYQNLLNFCHSGTNLLTIHLQLSIEARFGKNLAKAENCNQPAGKGRHGGQAKRDPKLGPVGSLLLLPDASHVSPILSSSFSRAKGPNMMFFLLEY